MTLAHRLIALKDYSNLLTKRVFSWRKALTLSHDDLALFREQEGSILSELEALELSAKTQCLFQLEQQLEQALHTALQTVYFSSEYNQAYSQSKLFKYLLEKVISQPSDTVFGLDQLNEVDLKKTGVQQSSTE